MSFVDRRTQLALAAINRRFYARHAAAFSATRERPWPGWGRLLERWAGDPPAPVEPALLDVGCGNGRFADAVGDRLGEAWSYRGLDASAELLEAARRRLDSPPPPARPAKWSLARWDLVTAAASGAAPRLPAAGRYDLVVAFGLMHHVPGFELRRALLRLLGGALAPGGMLGVSFWRFGERQRFRRRIVPWEEAAERGLAPALDPHRLERGDHLLAWGDGAAARYCHAASAAEIDELAKAPDLPLADDFLADGDDGALNRYLVWRADASRSGYDRPIAEGR